MKAIIALIALLSTCTSYAQSHLFPSNGLYATDAKYCGFRLYTSGENQDTLVYSGATNPAYPNIRCSAAGETRSFKWGRATKSDGTTVDGYMQMCAGAQNHWCTLIEVIDSTTILQTGNDGSAVIYYRW